MDFPEEQEFLILMILYVTLQLYTPNHLESSFGEGDHLREIPVKRQNSRLPNVVHR